MYLEDTSGTAGRRRRKKNKPNWAEINVCCDIMRPVHDTHRDKEERPQGGGRRERAGEGGEGRSRGGVATSRLNPQQLSGVELLQEFGVEAS